MYSDHYSNQGRSCLEGYRPASRNECTLHLIRKHLGITFFINAGVTNILFDEIDDPAQSQGCFVYRDTTIGVLLRYNINAGIARVTDSAVCVNTVQYLISQRALRKVSDRGALHR